MQCQYCKRETYVMHVCPYCKEYYCQEHQKPDRHNCPAYGQRYGPPATPQFRQPTIQRQEKTQEPSMSMENFQNKFFIITLALVIVEELLRLISYGIGNWPYLEANIYVALASLWLHPYVSSSIIFLLACLILFATIRLAKGQTTGVDLKNLLKKAVPIGVFTSLAIIIIFSIANWVIILLV